MTNLEKTEAMEWTPWRRVTRLCKSQRRALWLRYQLRERPPEWKEIDAFHAEDVLKIELRGGREGDDYHFTCAKGEPVFETMLDLMTLLDYQAEMSDLGEGFEAPGVATR